jgi:hypothetical protein
VSAIILPKQSYPRYPFINQSRVLSGANVIGMIDSARKYEIVLRSSTALEPSQNTGAGGFKEVELDRPPSFLLDDDSARTNSTTTDKIANFDFDDIAAA